MPEPGPLLNGGNNIRPQKRIFLALLTVTCLLFTLLLGLLWYVPYVGLSNISKQLPLILGIVFGANLGTTITGWMVALLGFKLKLGSLLLPVILIGALSLEFPARYSATLISMPRPETSWRAGSSAARA